MKTILFGATGMVGQGVLMECLDSPEVEAVLAVGRSACGVAHPKLREIVHRDLYDYAAIEKDLAGYDAGFFCLGVSSAGMKEADYTRVTYDLTLAAGQVLAKLNPGMTFIYVSGAGTDSTEKGRAMWARVKGKTENALLRLPFTAAYMFRPGFIQPMKGIRSKTRLYRAVYTIFGPLYPLMKRFDAAVTSTDRVGRAMIHVALKGYKKRVLENREINAAAR
jgi:uncharacterized protein YbjT (DUF2867 family)